MLQEFSSPYSCYCDSIKLLCRPNGSFTVPPSSWMEILESSIIDINEEGETHCPSDSSSSMFCYIISRGVELLDANEETSR